MHGVGAEHTTGHENSPNAAALGKNRVEEMSALCAMWTWCIKRAKDHGIADDTLVGLTQKFTEADVALLLDLQNLLHEKKNDFSFTDAKCFHEIMKHKVTCTDLVVSGTAKTELEASKLKKWNSI